MCRSFVRRAACFAAALSVFAFQPIGLAGAEQTAAEKQKELLAVLQSPDSPRGEKAITCKHLARCGDAEAVPALAALLADVELATWARIALEAIPDPAADAALREAASQLQGRLLVGVINSLGMRRDAQAVGILAQQLTAADAEVAASAAVALGRIGDAAATKALEQALLSPAAAPLAVRSAIAEGCILCAERSDQAGDSAAALRLFDAICRADVPPQRVLEATRGMILARKADGIAPLVELLQSDERARFALGLRVARELPGRAVTDALVAELERLAPERQALLMLALMDRQDRPPVSLLAQAAERGPKNVRITAIRAMRQQGDVSCVPVLLAVATEAAGDEELATAAAEALQELPGDNVNADLAARLAKAEGQTRRALIELAGWRLITDAVPELLKAADDADPAVRAAAFRALGETIDFASLDWLIERTVAAKSPEQMTVAGDALKAAAGRMPDRDACATKLDAAMTPAATPAKAKLLEALGAIGGSRALAAVVQASKSSDAALQGAAAQQLGDWMTPDAAPGLLELARNAADNSIKVRALRGYLRIARQFVVTDDERWGMYNTAMATALRDDERRLALDVLIRIPSPRTLAEATKRLGEPALRDAAANAAVAIAAKLAANNPQAVAEAMQQVLDSGVGNPAKAKAQELRDQAKARS